MHRSWRTRSLRQRRVTLRLAELKPRGNVAQHGRVAERLSAPVLAHAKLALAQGNLKISRAKTGSGNVAQHGRVAERLNAPVLAHAKLAPAQGNLQFSRS